MPRSLTLAALQHRCGIDPAANGEAVRALARAAATQGAQLIHICEGSLSGYIGPNKAHFRGWNVDWAAVRNELEATAAQAAEPGVWIVAGCHHRLTAPNLPHNSVFVFSDQGQVVGRYDKRFLSHSELSGFYTPGTEPLVVEVAGFRVAVAVCISPHQEGCRFRVGLTGNPSSHRSIRMCLFWRSSRPTCAIVGLSGPRSLAGTADVHSWRSCRLVRGEAANERNRWRNGLLRI